MTFFSQFVALPLCVFISVGRLVWCRRAMASYLPSKHTSMTINETNLSYLSAGRRRHPCLIALP
ncbi:MAG: hypothetical protein P8R36_01810, partial [Actinomycetota bacterium]|nr:hypothetical protein [Actinomycetota bacterium]